MKKVLRYFKKLISSAYKFTILHKRILISAFLFVVVLLTIYTLFYNRNETTISNFDESNIDSPKISIEFFNLDSDMRTSDIYFRISDNFAETEAYIKDILNEDSQIQCVDNAYLTIGAPLSAYGFSSSISALENLEDSIFTTKILDSWCEVDFSNIEDSYQRYDLLSANSAFSTFYNQQIPMSYYLNYFFPFDRLNIRGELSFETYCKDSKNIIACQEQPVITIKFLNLEWDLYKVELLNSSENKYEFYAEFRRPLIIRIFIPLILLVITMLISLLPLIENNDLFIKVVLSIFFGLTGFSENITGVNLINNMRVTRIIIILYGFLFIVFIIRIIFLRKEKLE